MFATALLDDAAAWLGLPLVFVITSLGVGLLVERASGVRLPTAALLPLGACGSICALLAVYRLGGQGWLAAALLVALTIAGGVLARHELRERLTPGPATAAGAAVAALYLAPVVLSGHWTWAGYNFLNDTAVQFLLADQLMHHGVELVHDGLSTRSQTIFTYLETGYPLGSHAQLATLATLLGAGVDVVYQGYLAMLAVTATVALYALARRSGLGPWSAAAAGALAMSANLIYQYALQGSIKELAACAAIVTTAMLGRELLSSDKPVRMAIPAGIAAAAAVSAFSTAAGPYLVILGLSLIGAAYVVPASALRSRLPLTIVAAVGIAAVAAVPTLIDAFSFADAANQSLASDATVASVFGQLQRPLLAAQAAGVWIAKDYSLPIDVAWRSGLTDVGIVLVLALATASAAVFLIRRREPGPVLLLLTTLVTAAVVAPRTSPYADAKLLAIASPTVLFAAACLALSARGRWGPPGLAAAGVMAVLVAGSAAYAYHGVKLAPVARMEALQGVMDHVGDRGKIMVDEVEEFGKYYGRDAPDLNMAFEAITPAPARPSGGGYHLDLDELEPGYVQEFDTIVTRKGPATSRPPANFRPGYGNRWYQAWVKDDAVAVSAHLALQGALDKGARPDCAAVKRLARAAPAGARLVAAPAPEIVTLDVVGAPDRPFGWPPIGFPPGVVQPGTPGIVERSAQVDRGTYDVWQRGSTGRRLHLRVDDRQISTVQGINTQGQWLEAGTIELDPGRHELEIERPGGNLEPGDAATSQIGPLALVRRESAALREVAPADARSLCGRRWDWIEVVER